MAFLQIALTFFIMANPIGNSPAVIALIKDYPLREQQKILLRESLFSFLLAVFFLFLGEIFLTNFNIQNFALRISGGVILLLVAIKMIFPGQEDQPTSKTKQVPFIVPIATPLITGASLIAMIMVYSEQEQNNIKIFLALLLAWIGVTAVLVTAPYLQVFLGKRGLLALEQLMGMLLAMMAIEMVVKGTSIFVTALNAYGA